MGKAVRLDRFLADSGAGTRTEVKKLIQKGMVQVNGEKAKKPELKIDPETDVVEFGGERIGARAEFVYYLLHKPAGYVSATEDTREKTVLDLVPKDGRRNLFPVGRLDKDTEGLLLITDDGQLAHRLLSPKKHVDKTYFAVTEDGEVKDEQKLIDDGDTAHGFGAEAADHDVIEQADKACDALLHDHRDDEADEVCVKLPVADEFFFVFFEHNSSKIS